MSKNIVKKVVAGGYCVGCGGCSVYDEKVTIKENNIGSYVAEIKEETMDGIDSVCPFSSVINEDDIAEELYSESDHFDKRVGYFRGVFTGYVDEGSYRENGSSGGVTTWVLQQLLEQKKIDGVIHVGSSTATGTLFEYKISENIDEVLENSKSRYYPVHFDSVLNEIKKTNKVYAFVGVPCFIKSVRLLMKADSDLRNRIKYCLAIFCGHTKSKSFSEMIGWQMGIQPKNIKKIDFRIKNDKPPVNNYSVEVTGLVGTENVVRQEEIKNLYGLDWGVGYFKLKACDWCDDIAGETADITCGDAWLPEFTNETKGTNIIVVRNREIHEILRKGVRQDKLRLTTQSVDRVYESQAGNYRHRQEGLSYRVEEATVKKIWAPTKRVAQSSFDVSSARKKIYLLRGALASKSHENFQKAIKGGAFSQFWLRNILLELRYCYYTSGLLSGIKRNIRLMIAYYKRNNQRNL